MHWLNNPKVRFLKMWRVGSVQTGGAAGHIPVWRVESFMSSAIYVLGFVAKGTLPENLKIDGLETGHSVVQREFTGITAVVSQVPLTYFVGEEAETRLNDIEWVAPRALNHQRAIEKIISLSPILPAQFGVLFSSFENLEKFVSGNHSAILEFLELTADKKEWGVRAYWDHARAKERLEAKDFTKRLSQIAQLSDGIRYFKEKQLKAEIDRKVTDQLKKVLVDVSKQLSDLSFDARKRKIIKADSGQDGYELVANWTFLLPDDRFDEFLSVLNDFNKRNSAEGIYLQNSGPWPPYSFVPDLIWDYT